jgi:hypothetical protein
MTQAARCAKRLDSQGVTTERRRAHAHEEEGWRGPVSDTSQGLLQRRPDAEGTDWRDHAWAIC